MNEHRNRSFVYGPRPVLKNMSRIKKKGRRIDCVSSRSLLTHRCHAVYQCSASSDSTEDCRELSLSSPIAGNSLLLARVFFFRARKKNRLSYTADSGLISVAIISRVSLYYTMAVTSAHAVINYDGSRNHYRGVSCNSGVLSVYIRL